MVSTPDLEVERRYRIIGGIDVGVEVSLGNIFDEYLSPILGTLVLSVRTGKGVVEGKEHTLG